VAEPPAVLLPPRPVQPPAVLRAAVQRLQDEQGRFRNVEVLVQDRLVYLRGSPSELRDFAALVARLPGVERVVIVAGR
jgi:hypothetical protein